jgi:hypothetical protein
LNFIHQLNQIGAVCHIPIVQVQVRVIEQMIYEENPYSFEEIIKALLELKEKINALNWKFKTPFDFSE